MELKNEVEQEIHLPEITTIPDSGKTALRY